MVSHHRHHHPFHINSLVKKIIHPSDSINSVEDTKGNNGEKGQLIVTNLRIIWQSHRMAHTNLSIGYNCVSSISIKAVKSRLKGSTQALYVLTKYQNSRFEFIFTSLVKNSPRLFTTVQAVLRAYETTKLYRELKLRGSVIRNQELILLPHEQVYDKIPGAWNLSADQVLFPRAVDSACVLSDHDKTLLLITLTLNPNPNPSPNPKP